MTAITTQALAVIEPRPVPYESTPESAHEAAEQTEIGPSVRQFLAEALRQHGRTAALLTPVGLPVTMAVMPGGSAVGLFAVPVLMTGAAAAGMAWCWVRDLSRDLVVTDQAAAQLQLIELANGWAGEAR